MQTTTHNESPYYIALRGLRRGLVTVAGVSGLISVLMLTGSIYMMQVYDRVLNSGSIPTLLALFAIVAMLYGFLAFYDATRMRFLSRLSLQLDDHLAGLLFRHDIICAQTAQAKRQASSDLEMLRNVLSGPATLAAFDLPFTLLFLAVLFLIHPVLGGLTLLGMGIACLLALANRAALKNPTKQAQQFELSKRRFADGVYQSGATLSALGMQGFVTHHWLQLHKSMLAHHQLGTDPSELLSAISRSLRMLLQAGLLTAAAWLVIRGQISAGAIVASSILSGRALMPVDQLIGQWRLLAAARMSHDRLMAIDIGKKRMNVGLPALSGKIVLSNISKLGQAGMLGQERLKLLNGVSFSLSPGDGLGIVGASGSGKSTLARLIVGAVTPDEGDIRFDGATAAQWETDALGRQIGYLQQRVDLLPGSIRDNIARFDPHASDAAVIKAAREAGVHDMILRLPLGYATAIGLEETPLSGGQIQRIGLARALYGAPKLLVLDEPNAHLDLAGEADLTRCLLSRRASGVTVIVLAHRAAALAAIDRMIVLQDGEVTKDGARDAILAALAPFERSVGHAATKPVEVTITPLSARTSPDRLDRDAASRAR